jgi:hypothetical protein
VSYDYKISFDRISGELKLWINNAFVTSWVDSSPFASGSAVSFRSGNAKFIVDDFRVFRSRTNTTPVLVGAANTKDLRNENPSPLSPAGKISSITKDNMDNLSAISTESLNIDWTKPLTVNMKVNDGTANDQDTTYVSTQLDLNYTTAKDTNSGVSVYYYAIGTSAGTHNIVPWTANGLNLSSTETLTLQTGQKYYIMVKAMNGAGLVSDSLVSDGILFLGTTGIKEWPLLQDVSIYPNPTTDKATLSIIHTEQQTVSYTLMDAQGKLIETKPLMMRAGINTLEIDTRLLGLGKGIYFITLQAATKSLTKKLVVE